MQINPNFLLQTGSLATNIVIRLVRLTSVSWQVNFWAPISPKKHLNENLLTLLYYHLSTSTLEMSQSYATPCVFLLDGKGVPE